MEITKEQLTAYREVQNSGQVNMWDVNRVMILSGLNRDEILYIMKNYTELNKSLLGITIK